MRSVLSIFAAIALMACAHGASVSRNPSAQFPVAISDQAPAFVFPVNLSHVNAKGGDPTEMGVAVTAAVASHFGSKVVAGQQLFPLVGNLSFDLAEHIRSQVNNKTFNMSGGAEPTATALANMMENIIAQLVELKLLDKPIKFKYVIAFHSHGSSKLGGKLLDVDSWGGIYDVETKEIVSYIKADSTMPNDPKAVTAQLPAVYNRIIEQLIAGHN
jgi:hypothetical protein